MYNKYVLTAAMAGLLIATVPAAAGPNVDESRAMDADGQISLGMVEGDLEVIGWDSDSFELTGELGSDKHELVVTGEQDDWEIEIRMEKNWGWSWSSKNSGDTDLTLKVPHSASVELSVVSADIDVENLDGDYLDIESVSGDLNIEVESSRIELESVSGDVEIRASNSSLELETVSGDVYASGITSHAAIESVSGDLRVDADNLESLYASSVSGDVTIDASLTSNARVELETHSGEIDLLLPANTRFDLDSDTFSGDVDNEFGSDSSSNISIDAETFSGNITIKRK